SRNIPYVAVDRDMRQVKHGRKRGMPVVYGNATDHDLLEKLGAERAALVLVALGDAKAATQTLQAIHRHWPNLKLLARARDAQHAAKLSAMGVEDVVPETLEASLQLGGLVLRMLGVPTSAVNDTIERARSGGHQGDHDVDERPPALDDRQPDGKSLPRASSGPTLPGSD
ncbi:MAG: NAD-binding protein, partial [Geminicoccaceae bacterium]